MAVALSLVLSILALLATCYQAFLQRTHNEKSVKPLPQIDFMDLDGTLYVHVKNNGVGPMTVDKLVFTRDGKTYHRIQDCLNIDPKKYHHVEVSDDNKKVIIPGGFLLVFSEELDPDDNQKTIVTFRKELSALSLRVEAYDIYDNRISVEKSLKWFGRHL